MNGPVAGSKFCATCNKTANADGVPKFGDILDRATNPEWVSPVDGKAPVPYIKFWLKKLADKATRDQVEAEATKFGLTVPAEQWVQPEKVQRRRKTKSAVVDSSSDGEPEPAAAAVAPPAAPRPAAPKPKTKRAPKAKAQPPVQAQPEPLLPVEPKAPPAPAEAAPAPVAEPTDLVQQSLATELETNAYDAETEDEDDVEELNVALQDIDHGDGHGPRAAMVDPDNNVYCYGVYMASGDLKQVGHLVAGVFKALQQ